MNTPEISSAENMYLARMRAADKFVRGLTPADDPSNISLIDFDFAPDHTELPAIPDSLTGFRSELERLSGDIENDDRNADSMRRNLESAGLVIGVLAGDIVIGETMTHGEFVEKTMGLRPEKVPKKDLRRQREEIEKVVRDLGFRYEAEDRDAFNEAFAIPEINIVGSIGGMSEVMDSDLDEVFGTDLLEGLERPELRVEEHEDTWQGYFGLDEDKEPFIIVNSNPKIKQTLIGARAVVDHEGGHRVSYAVKNRGIKAGELSSELGISPFFSHSYTQDEVIARTVEEYVLGEKSDHNVARYLYAYLNMQYGNDVSANMMIKLNGGRSKEEVIKYGMKWRPYEKPEKIKNEVNMYANNLIYNTVFGVDQHALRLGREIAGRPAAERRATLSRLCLESLSTDELLEV